MRTKSIFAALIATLLLVACTSGKKDAADNVADSMGSPSNSDPTAHADGTAQAPATARAQNDYRALSQNERSLLATIDSRYFGTLSNSSPGEDVDLKKLGFPDVNTWVAAEKMTDDELLRNARSGGHLEKELYIDRVVSLIPGNNWKGVGDTAEDNALATKIMDARSFALRNIGTTKSPFAVYQAAALFNTTEVGGNPAMIAASFQLAAELGDTRATRMLQSYMSANRNIDAKGVLAAYTFLKSDLGHPGGS